MCIKLSFLVLSMGLLISNYLSSGEAIQNESNVDSGSQVDYNDYHLEMDDNNMSESELEFYNSLLADKYSNELSELRTYNFYLLWTVALLLLAIVVGLMKARYMIKMMNYELSSQRERWQNQYENMLRKPAPMNPIPTEKLNKKIKRPLTAREIEILEISMNGNSNKEVAEAVYVSLNTVKFHMRNIYTKLGVNNKKEALNYVLNVT